jgi:hypothetical protein
LLFLVSYAYFFTEDLKQTFGLEVNLSVSS